MQTLMWERYCVFIFHHYVTQQPKLAMLVTAALNKGINWPVQLLLKLLLVLTSLIAVIQ